LKKAYQCRTFKPWSFCLRIARTKRLLDEEFDEDEKDTEVDLKNL